MTLRTDLPFGEEASAMDSDNKAPDQRCRWISVLSKAKPADVSTRLAGIDHLPDYTVIRPAESGAVMVRGRAGGTGGAFNLGEMTVTRCVVQLVDKARPVIGHAYVAGRDKHHAEQAALVDALMQTERWQDEIKAAIIEPLATLAAKAKTERSKKVAATKVNFFTMVRGED